MPDFQNLAYLILKLPEGIFFFALNELISFERMITSNFDVSPFLSIPNVDFTNREGDIPMITFG